jgi:hypothetical protein
MAITGHIGIAAAGSYFSELSDKQEQAPDIKQLLVESGEPWTRRTSRLTDLALLGASRALQGRADLSPSCAIVLGSDQSGRCDTAKMLAAILERGEAPMPFDFINVSNNMAGYYVARRYRLQGANLAVSRRGSAFESAMEVALQQLESKAVPLVLLGSVDESCRPLSSPLSSRGSVLQQDTVAGAEGSSWFLLLGPDAADECGAWIEYHHHFADWARVAAYLDQIDDLPGTTLIASERISQKVRETSFIEARLWLAGAEHCPSGSAHALVSALEDWDGGSTALYIHGDDEAGYLLLQIEKNPAGQDSLSK